MEKISVVVSCYNEEKALPLFYEEMERVRKKDFEGIVEFEYIFVNDGSKDNTIEVCEIIWGDEAFQRPDGRKEIIQGIFDVQTVSLSLFVEQNKKALIDNKDIIKTNFENSYRDDKEFENSIRQFTSNIKQVNYRISTMNNIILEAIS